MSKLQDRKANLTNAGRGRPKGSANKTTTAARAVIEKAVEQLGGAARLVEWAKEAPENERAFWATIFPKLLPLQLTGENGGPIKTQDVSPATVLNARLDAIANRAAGASE